MKLYIGKYRNWVGVYQLANLLKYVGFSEKRIDKIGDRLACTKLVNLCQWVHDKKKRKVKIKIHDYDIWSLDVTLAYIILPCLIRLKVEKHGYPNVDDCDVPEWLTSHNAEEKETDNSWDSNAEKRWDWVLDEMIWAFTQIHADNDWEDQYHSGEMDTRFVPCKFDEKGEPSLFSMEKGPNDTHVFDSEGYTKHQERITKGLTLFGRYFQSLWD